MQQSKLKPSLSGIYTIAESPTHKVIADKVQGQWWIELINRATGHVRIFTAKRKDVALSWFNGMTMEEIIAFYDRQGVPESPMYKAGVI